MKQKILLIFLLFTYSAMLCAQRDKTCNTPEEESLADLNSITKCTIEPSKKGGKKKTKQISVRVSASKRRFRKTRKSVSKKLVNDGNTLNSSGIARVNKSLKLKKDLISFKNNLSEEQVKKAKRFNHVDEIPTFKKCKGLQGDERLDCFNSEMVKHINNNLQYPSEAVRNNIQGDVWIRFIVDVDGTITNIKTLDLGNEGREVLDEEAMRVVSKLPAFEPGKIGGEKIPVKYGFPINFSLDN